MPGSGRSSASGISRTSASACPYGNSGSAVPWMTRVGAFTFVTPPRGGSPSSMRPWLVMLAAMSRLRSTTRSTRRRVCGSSKYSGVESRRSKSTRYSTTDVRSDQSGSGGGAAKYARSSSDIGGSSEMPGPPASARVVDRDTLCQSAPHRDTDQVCAAQPERVEHADGISGQVRPRVPGRAGRVGHRLAGVTVVVTDGEPAAGREPLAALVLPPVHRGASAAHEQDRGVALVADGVHAQVYAVDVHDAAAHPAILPYPVGMTPVDSQGESLEE